jgi:hypothetical protein
MTAGQAALDSASLVRAAELGYTAPVTSPPVVPAVAQLPRFAESSFWYQVVSSAPLAADSAAVAVDALRQAMAYYPDNGKPEMAINTLWTSLQALPAGYGQP